MAKLQNNFPFQQVDDFKLENLIYEGQHTLVFLAFQFSLRRTVVIKLLKPHVKHRKEWIERFQREARVCANLKHPNIVDVYTLGEKDGYHFIASEYVEGLSLKGLLSELAPQPLEIIFSISEQILQALYYVHQHNIVHRDLKPGNILINFLGQAKLTDFGLAQIGEEPSVTQQGTLIGSPAYMAPEQVMGTVLDGRTDLFALGAIIFEMLSGQQAFGGENYSTCLYKIINENPPPLNQLRDDLPEEIEGFLAKFLAKSPEERWSSAGEALENLEMLAKKLNIAVKSDSVAKHLKLSLPDDSPGKRGRTRGASPPMPAEKVNNKSGQHHRSKFLWMAGGVIALVLLIALSLPWWNPAGKAPLKENNLNEQPVQFITDTTQNDTTTRSLARNDSLNPVVKDDGREKGNNKGEESRQPRQANPKRSVDTVVKSTIDQPPPEFRETLQSNEEIENTPALASLSLAVEPWGKIIIDSLEADSHTTHKTFSIKPGKHTVTFLHPNFSPQAMQVDLKPGEQKNLSWSFLKSAGYLWVEVRPWAEIYIDNKMRDVTPLKSPIVLPSGEHLLELKHPQLRPHREMITIQAGDTIFVKVVLHNNN